MRAPANGLVLEVAEEPNRLVRMVDPGCRVSAAGGYERLLNAQVREILDRGVARNQPLGDLEVLARFGGVFVPERDLGGEQVRSGEMEVSSVASRRPIARLIASRAT